MRYFAAPILAGIITLMYAMLMATSLSAQLSGHLYHNAIQSSDLDIPDGVLFEVKHAALQNLKQNKSHTLQLALPYKNQTELRFELEAFNIHAAGFAVTEKSAKGEKAISYELGKYYKGTIVGSPSSRVVIAIQGDEISGTIMDGNKQINLGKLKNRNQHILYEAEGLEDIGEFTCGTLPDYTRVIETKDEKQKQTGCTAAVNIYIECDYQMYLNFSSNTTSVTNYVNTLFTEVAVLYLSENIPVQLSQVTVWSSNDGYANGTAGLTDFSTALNNSGFNGDLAQLLTNDIGSNGGVAYVDQLCGGFPYGYSDILNTSQPVPTYSWDVQVLTHEIGHNLGSNHTHDCVWGPNKNQQIDDCGSQVLGGGSCYNASSPIIPSSGGSIMSYCHLNSVGINFNTGFGQEPGNLIRANHTTCMCDNSTCESAITITESGSFVAEPASGGGASSHQVTNADWFIFTPSHNGTIDISSCNEGVDTRLLLHSGSCSNLTLHELADDDCTSAGTNTYAAEILNFSVTAGTTYFIEWDDRWSTAGFNWMFTFTESTSTGPTITCPSIYVGEYTCSAHDYDPSLTGEATGSIGTVVTYADLLTTTTCSVLVDREWTATTASGATSSCNQIIDLLDTTNPTVLHCPNNISVVSATDCHATVTWVEPTATDLCTSLMINATHSSGTSFDVGNHSIVYTFTDDCSNSSSCEFTIVVEDGCSVLAPCDGSSISLTGVLDQDSYRAELSIQTDGNVQGGASTIFTAGQSMELKSGFEVSQGAVLESKIDDCQN